MHRGSAPEVGPGAYLRLALRVGQYRGRTQSGGVKGVVIAPDPGPCEPGDPDGDDF